MRYYALIGFLSLIVVWTSIAVAVAVSQCFDWSKSALSDLGDWVAACEGDSGCLASCNRLSEPVFNYGLVVSGVLLLVASYGLIRARGSYTYILPLSSISLALIGIITEGMRPYHFIVAAIFFLTLPIAALIAGAVEFRRDRKIALLSLLFGILSFVGVALFFMVKINVVGGMGLAVPEVIAAAASSLWLTVIIYRYLWVKGQ